MSLALALEFLLVCLIAVAYRQSWLAECARADRFRDQTNDYMVENTALRRELAEPKNHARYFESLSEWQAEHHRVPTDEERDLLWERIRAKLDGAKLPESYSYYTLNGLIRASGGKLS